MNNTLWDLYHDFMGWLSTVFLVRAYYGGCWYKYQIPVRNLDTREETGEYHTFWSQEIDHGFSMYIVKTEDYTQA